MSEQKHISKDIIWRVAIVYFGALVFAFLITGRVIQLQFFQSGKYNKKENNTFFKNEIIPPNRGNIYTADGRPLASSIPYFEIRMDLGCEGLSDKIFYDNLDSLCYSLSLMFKNKTLQGYRKMLKIERRKKNRYLLIQKGVTYGQLQEMKKFPIFRMGKYKGGVIYIQENKRVNPFGNLAYRTIGYIGKKEKNASVGFEGAYDNYLKGVQGIRVMRKIATDAWMPVNDDNEIQPQDGKDLITTLDINIQDVAHNALFTQLSQNNADHGTAVLMEVSTGEIKAIVNLKKDKDGNYTESYNFATGASTEPGSTFKLASLIVAMEDGYIDLDDSVNTENGSTKYYDQVMYDSERRGYGIISVKEAFEKSSNVGISKLITKHYYGKEQRFVERLYRMNLNEKLGLDLLGEGKPIIKDPQDPSWSGTTLPWMSVGYEIQLTPLQILTFYNAIANNGKMVKPKFVKALTFHGETIMSFDTEVINPSICSEETIKKAKIMLEGVVENGTGKNIQNEHYKIAGKTGTAQIANKKYGYRHEGSILYQASFVGYFPANHPMYSCIVVINSPSNSIYYGSSVAGPVFKEIADKVYAGSIEMHDDVKPPEDIATALPQIKTGYKPDMEYIFNVLHIPLIKDISSSEWVSVNSSDSLVRFQKRIMDDKNTVPDVTGMGARDAVGILENSGLKVIIRGRGMVSSQSLIAGSKINPGDIIFIELT